MKKLKTLSCREKEEERQKKKKIEKKKMLHLNKTFKHFKHFYSQQTLSSQRLSLNQIPTYPDKKSKKFYTIF